MGYITIIATILTILVNIAATTIPLGGLTTKEISDSFNVYFVPAAYVFSIWGIIYIAILVFSFSQLKKKISNSKLISEIRIWYIVSCLSNIAWIFLWQFHFPTLSIVPMIVLLLSLIAVYYKLSKSKEMNEDNNKYLIKLPISIYLGWISVATIANAAVFLYVLNWNGFGIAPQMWSTVMILIAGVLGVIMLKRERDHAYALVLIWATIGIIVKFLYISRAVSISAAFVAILLSVLSVAILIKDNKRKKLKK
ncbi:MAG: TspO/MBR family protein [bacterium]